MVAIGKQLSLNNLSEIIADHHSSLCSFFQWAIANLSYTFYSSPRHADDTIEIALKLLLLAFKNVTTVFGSVEWCEGPDG